MFKKLKDRMKRDDHLSETSSQLNSQEHKVPQEQQYSGGHTGKRQALSNPPPYYGASASTNPEYAAPQGPPCGHVTINGANPSSRLPLNHGTHDAAFPGLPPGKSSPSPGAQPSYPPQPAPSWDPPPYHDWTVIPDTAILPPPPSMGYDISPTANASAEEGDTALAWTNANPLWPAQNLQPSIYAAIQNAQLALLKAPSYIGDLLPQPQAGHWRCRTHVNCGDSSILTNLPLYSVYWDSPLTTNLSKTVYFELKVLGLGRGGSSLDEADAGIAIGFVAPPYPTFRLPGWERASVGVHGDDGRKYVNDPWGGIDFTTAFKPGETVGIGITFSVPKNPPLYEKTQQPCFLDINVFFTRNGKWEAGWDGNEELDLRSEGGNIGLRGDCDLFPAIGVFGGVDFDVFFHPSQWMYNPD